MRRVAGDKKVAAEADGDTTQGAILAMDHSILQKLGLGDDYENYGNNPEVYLEKAKLWVAKLIAVQQADKHSSDDGEL